MSVTVGRAHRLHAYRSDVQPADASNTRVCYVLAGRYWVDIRVNLAL